MLPIDSLFIDVPSCLRNLQRSGGFIRDIEDNWPWIKLQEQVKYFKLIGSYLCA